MSSSRPLLGGQSFLFSKKAAHLAADLPRLIVFPQPVVGSGEAGVDRGIIGIEPAANFQMRSRILEAALAQIQLAQGDLRVRIIGTLKHRLFQRGSRFGKLRLSGNRAFKEQDRAEQRENVVFAMASLDGLMQHAGGVSQCVLKQVFLPQREIADVAARSKLRGPAKFRLGLVETAETAEEKRSFVMQAGGAGEL